MQNRNIILTTILFALGSFAVPQKTQGVSPPPDGGYPGGNTAEGTSALLSRTTGMYNTAVGIYSLLTLTDGSFCTGVGAGALLSNTAAKNTATGAGALLSNTSGGRNTGDGAFALFSNSAGNGNTAIGDSALFSNTTAGANTAAGFEALFSNVNGISNTAVGGDALRNSTGNANIALGEGAGGNVTTASNAICIGTDGNNVSDSCYIGNIFISTVNDSAVFINSNGRLGIATSSRRFKEEIKPMDKASEALLALKPVTFRYKKEIDQDGRAQFGLVAEEVQKVNPDLVVRDKEGKAYSVRYEQVNAMLLNEFLKAYRKIQEQEATITQLGKELETVIAHAKEQDSKIQKVSDRIEISKSEPAVVTNDR